MCGLLLFTAGCGTPSGATGGTLTVFAAASLKPVFTELAAEYERMHPGTTVALSFAGSSDLAAQLNAGAPADVFASADTDTMDRVDAEKLLGSAPVDFATNTLVIAVPAGNPASVEGLADLARAGTKTVICAEQVPCGAAAAAVQRAAGVELYPVSEESSVTDVLGKITSGQADAGLVYVTDVRAAAGSVEGIPFTESAGVVNTYQIAAVDGGNRVRADAFLDLVTGTSGRSALADAGFGAAQ